MKITNSFEIIIFKNINYQGTGIGTWTGYGCGTGLKINPY